MTDEKCHSLECGDLSDLSPLWSQSQSEKRL